MWISTDILGREAYMAQEFIRTELEEKYSCRSVESQIYLSLIERYGRAAVKYGFTNQSSHRHRILQLVIIRTASVNR